MRSVFLNFFKPCDELCVKDEDCYKKCNKRLDIMLMCMRIPKV